MTDPGAGRLWAGRILSGVAVAFLAIDALAKLLRLEAAVTGTAELGWGNVSVVSIGMLLAIGILLYVIPRTSVLGALYLAGYLGGAVATHVRIGSPLATHVLFPVYVAVLLWGGLALRNPRLAALLTSGR